MSNEIESKLASTEKKATLPNVMEQTPVTPTAVTTPEPASTCTCTATPSANSAVFNQGSFPTFENCQLVATIGQPSYDFGTESNLDVFTAYMETWHSNLPEEMQEEFKNSPDDHVSMIAFLLYRDASGDLKNLFMYSQLIWLIDINSTPIYSINPSLAAFSDSIYSILVSFLANSVGFDVSIYNDLMSRLKPKQKKLKDDQNELLKYMTKKINDNVTSPDDVMRMVLPGYISGSTRLINYTALQSVIPVAYGLADWTIDSLIEKTYSTGSISDEEKESLISMLNRLYYCTVNRGQSPDDRALNYSIYNTVVLSSIVKDAIKNKLEFSGYTVKPSKISRQHSIIRDVQLTFFDPSNTTIAATTYLMQVDVSGITPVMIGSIQQWKSLTSVDEL